MTQEQFKEYCSKHVIVGMEPGDIGLIVKFINGESISIRANYDGEFVYTHSLEPIPSSKELINQLHEIAPTFIEKMIEKYS